MSHQPAARVRLAFLTVLGSGYLRPASGTWGSFVALILIMPVLWGAWSGRLWSWTPELVALLGVAVACIASGVWGQWAVAHFRSKDPKSFVLDELAGQWIALLLLPHAGASGDWRGLAVVVAGQFFLFRVMDVFKPAPARQLERLPHGWGILCDDLMAGVYANLAGQVLWRWGWGERLAQQVGLL